MKIAIIGAGAFGTALGGVLEKRGITVEYFDPKIEKTLEEVCENAEFIILAVPSVAAPKVLPNLPKDAPLIIATKGILDTCLINDFKDVMVLSGPGFANDIKAGIKIALTTTDKRVEGLFGSEYFSFDLTDDIRGVLLCGALKNVYAIIAGMADFEAESEEWEKFIKEACLEMKEILKANGADPKTVDLYCGIGDLRLTCNYPSRNYEFGRILRQNPSAKPEKTVEGISALSRIKNGGLSIPGTAVKLKELIEKSKIWN